MAKKIPAVSYLRTSSAANVGTDKDSDKRQRAAIQGFAKAAGYQIVGEYYDRAVSGSDPVGERKGFREMLQRVASNGAKTILVESPDRFARDLAVQLAGHDMLKTQGIALVPASAPDFFTEDTPTAVLVRQVLGAIAEFEKASTVAKLAAARKRKRDATGKCEGRKSLAVVLSVLSWEAANPLLAVVLASIAGLFSASQFLRAGFVIAPPFRWPVSGGLAGRCSNCAVRQRAPVFQCLVWLKRYRSG